MVHYISLGNREKYRKPREEYKELPTVLNNWINNVYRQCHLSVIVDTLFCTNGKHLPELMSNIGKYVM